MTSVEKEDKQKDRCRAPRQYHAAVLSPHPLISRNSAGQALLLLTHPLQLPLKGERTVNHKLNKLYFKECGDTKVQSTGNICRKI